jgi:hypothetical protein
LQTSIRVRQHSLAAVRLLLLLGADARMKPSVVTHNTISLDGAYKDFAIDIGLHYEVAERFEAPIRLIGSTTAIPGLGAPDSIAPETEQDRLRPHVDRADRRVLGHRRLKWLVAGPTPRNPFLGLLQGRRRPRLRRHARRVPRLPAST